ncbi:flagellar biosynthetic protein FliO [Angustibacter aerolatus]
MELASLVGRMAVSLVVVLAVLWLAARALRKGQRRASKGVDLDVLARQPLAQRASLAVVRLGDQALVLGVTEHRVELLAQQPLASLVPDEVATEVAVPQQLAPAQQVDVAQPVDVAQVPVLQVAPTRAQQRSQQQPQGPLAGSALSPQTWGKALDAVRELTVRK